MEPLTFRRQPTLPCEPHLPSSSVSKIKRCNSIIYYWLRWKKKSHFSDKNVFMKCSLLVHSCVRVCELSSENCCQCFSQIRLLWDVWSELLVSFGGEISSSGKMHVGLKTVSLLDSNLYLYFYCSIYFYFSLKVYYVTFVVSILAIKLTWAIWSFCSLINITNVYKRIYCGS